MDATTTSPVLATILWLSFRDVVATRDAILREMPKRSADGPMLDDAFDDLVARGSLAQSGTAYVLTAAGRRLAKQVWAARSGDWMIAGEHSPAYRTYCRQVYGADRCQFDMLTQP